MNKNLKQNSGVTLIELLIVAAGLAGLAVVGMQMMRTQMKSSTKSTFDSETNLITNEIISILSHPDRCFTTLGGKNALSTTTGINSINNSKYYSLQSGTAQATSGYGNQSIQIASYTITSDATNLLNNSATLTINYQNKELLKGSLGSTTIAKKINLYVKVDGANNITSCRSLSSSTADIWSRGDVGDIYYNGGVRVGDETQATTCDVSTEGTQRYNKAIHAMEYCGASGSPLVYSWKSFGGGSTPMTYVTWGAPCKTGDTTLYNGSSFNSALLSVGSGSTDFLCSNGMTRSHYRVNDARSGYLWEAPISCSMCATQPGKICYENWGSQTCASGYSAAYAGYMFQAAWNSYGTSGKIICRAGAQVGGVYVANSSTSVVTGYGWIDGEPCAICCTN